jgi:hypothetical protein
MIDAAYRASVGHFVAHQHGWQIREFLIGRGDDNDFSKTRRNQTDEVDNQRLVIKR